ncbi:MAG: sugar phosphate isomerase/epimerase family protein [Bacteroidota bacterium]
MNTTRRKALKQMSKGAAALSLMSMGIACGNNKNTNTAKQTVPEMSKKEPFFKISLAQWSLHRSFFGPSRDAGYEAFVKALMTDSDSILQGELNPMDFPKIAKQQYGLDAIEFVNTFYFSKAKNMDVWKDMKDRCDSEGVKPLLIMCDALGDLGDLDAQKRQTAIENHYPWVDVAKFLGCHSIRVNAAGKGTAEEVKAAAIEGLGGLTEYGAANGVNIIVENHGGYSSNGAWLASVMEGVNSPFCGTLPDFGNFCIERAPGDYSKCLDEYDRYQGTKELMPYAKGVSGKTHEFDAEGNEVHTDYRKILQIVKDAGYTGYIDIEYEGDNLSEAEGIMATKKLLERVGAELA